MPKSASDIAQDMVDKAADRMGVSEEKQKEIKKKADKENKKVVDDDSPVEKFGKKAKKKMRGKSSSSKSKTKSQKKEKKESKEKTRKQEEIEEQVENIQEYKKDGLTRSERLAIGTQSEIMDLEKQFKRVAAGEVKQKSMEDLARSATSEEDAAATKEMVSGGQRDIAEAERKDKLSRTKQNVEQEIERVEDKENVESVTVDGEEMTKQQYLNRLENTSSELENEMAEAEASIKESEARQKRLVEQDPLQGKTTENYIDENRFKTSALVGVQPEAFNALSTAVTGGNVQEKVVEPMVEEVRKGERGPEKAAVKSLASPLGIAGTSVAAGAVTQSGLNLISVKEASMASGTGKAASIASKGGFSKAANVVLSASAVGATAKAGKDVYSEVQEGDEADALAKVAQFGLGAAGFRAGMKAYQPSAASKPRVSKSSTGRSESRLVKRSGGRVATGKSAAKLKQKIKYPNALGKTRYTNRVAEIKLNAIQSTKDSTYAAGKVSYSEGGKQLGSETLVSISRNTGIKRRVGSSDWNLVRTIAETASQGKQFGYSFSKTKFVQKGKGKTTTGSLNIGRTGKGYTSAVISKDTVYDTSPIQLTFKTSSKNNLGIYATSSSTSTSADGLVQVKKVATTSPSTQKTSTSMSGLDIYQATQQKTTGETVSVSTGNSSGSSGQQAKAKTESVDTSENFQNKAKISTVPKSRSRSKSRSVGPAYKNKVELEKMPKRKTEFRNRPAFNTGFKTGQHSRSMQSLQSIFGVSSATKAKLRTRAKTRSKFKSKTMTSQMFKSDKSFVPAKPGIPIPEHDFKGFPSRKSKDSGQSPMGKQRRKGVAGDIISVTRSKAATGKADIDYSENPGNTLGFDIRSAITKQEKEQDISIDLY